jgi:hypothetical protein
MTEPKHNPSLDNLDHAGCQVITKAMNRGAAIWFRFELWPGPSAVDYWIKKWLEFTMLIGLNQSAICYFYYYYYFQTPSR